MKSPALLALLAAAAPAMGPAEAVAQRRNDQMQAFDGRRQGKLMSLRDIERRIVPNMGGAEYLGSDFDGDTGIYTLKFLRNGNVIWVDVDGRSGNVVGRTGR
jgi:hypothetical protein